MAKHQVPPLANASGCDGQQHKSSTRRVWLTQWPLSIAAIAWSFDLSSQLEAAEPLTADVSKSAGLEKSVPQWPYEVTAGLFRIHADFEITPASDFIAELELLVKDVGRLLETPRPTANMHIVLFGKSDDYRRYMGHYYPELPERRALFIQQRGTAMLFAHRHSDMATDLRHESVHALLNESHQTLPLWLDEGLAEYFEIPAAQRWSGHTHLAEIKQREPQSVGELEKLEALDQFFEMTGEHYRDAWSWVHFLLHRRPETRQLLLEQLAGRRASRPIMPLSRTISMHVPDLREQWREHFASLG